MMSDTAIIIMNPASGAARKGKHLKAVEMLDATGLDVQLWPTERPMHATELAARAAALGPRFVMAAGGDGTINEVLNGLANTQTPMAILPIGTANVLALEVGIPLDPVGAAKAALTRSARTIPLGLIEAEGAGPRYFCLWAGAGFDAAVVHNIDSRLKRLTGKFAFVYSSIRTLVRWPSATLTVNGVHKCQTLMVCRAAKYAGSFVLAPGADIADETFRVCLVGGSGRRHMFVFAMAAMMGAHERLGFVHLQETPEVRIEGMGHVHIDGDDYGHLPARITTVPGALRLIY